MANALKRFGIAISGRKAAAIADYIDVMLIANLSGCLAVWWLARTSTLVAGLRRP